MNKRIILSQLPSYLMSLWSFYLLIDVLSSENPPFWKVVCAATGFAGFFLDDFIFHHNYLQKRSLQEIRRIVLLYQQAL